MVRKTNKVNVEILCACNCGQRLWKYDEGWRARKYKLGHNFRIQENRECYACGLNQTRHMKIKRGSRNYECNLWYTNPPIGVICTSCFEIIFRRESNRNRSRVRRKSVPNFYEVREKINNLAYKRNPLHNNRLKIVRALGGYCICRNPNCWHKGHCKVKDIRTIHLDHKNGDGAKHRKQFREVGYMYNYYARHLDEAKKIFQTLCANCDRIKGVEVADYTISATN